MWHGPSRPFGNPLIEFIKCFKESMIEYFSSSTGEINFFIIPWSNHDYSNGPESNFQMKAYVSHQSLAAALRKCFVIDKHP